MWSAASDAEHDQELSLRKKFAAFPNLGREKGYRVIQHVTIHEYLWSGALRHSLDTRLTLAWHLTLA